MVYVKLQPNRQTSFAKRSLSNLLKRYYEPFTVELFFNPIAYKLVNLTLQIHHVFHISLLKGFHGDSSRN